MKKSAFPAALLLLGVALSGCPIYDGNDSGCFDDFDCRDGYSCDGPSGVCVKDGAPSGSSDACSRPTDCGVNETCNHSGICTAGDCHFTSVGCVRGYECSSSTGRWECLKEGSGAGGSGVGGNDAGGNDAGGAPSGSAGEPNMSSGGEVTAGAGGN